MGSRGVTDRTMRWKSGRFSAGEGFTLVEVLVAMTTLVIGLVGTALLLGVALRSNMVSKNVGDATILAQEKLEELKNLNMTTNPKVQPGSPSTLDSNTTNYHDVVTGHSRRWAVAAGLGNTRAITVRVIPDRITALNKVVEMQTIVRTR